MGRKLKISKVQFLAHYKKAHSIEDLTRTLEISRPTAYNYLERYNLLVFTTLHLQGRFLSHQIADDYKFDVTIDNLAKKYELSPSTIRFHLRKFIVLPHIYYLTKDYALPKKITHLKVIHALIANPEALDDPRKLLKLPGLTANLINDYWLHMSDGKQNLSDYDVLGKEEDE